MRFETQPPQVPPTAALQALHIHQQVSNRPHRSSHSKFCIGFSAAFDFEIPHRTVSVCSTKKKRPPSGLRIGFGAWFGFEIPRTVSPWSLDLDLRYPAPHQRWRHLYISDGVRFGMDLGYPDGRTVGCLTEASQPWPSIGGVLTRWEMRISMVSSNTWRI